MNLKIHTISLSLFLTLLLAGRASAALYRLPQEPPRTFADMQRTVKQDIPAQLSTAMCGGWDKEAMIGRVPGEGVIAEVIGVPGRNADLTRNRESGMAWRVEEGGKRNDGFQYPDDMQGNHAWGLSTACLPNDENRVVKQWVWEDGDAGEGGRYVERELDGPYFTDPPCNAGPEATGVQSPTECRRFCVWLNTLQYDDCQVFERLEGGGWKCAAWGKKYLCSGQWVNPPQMPKPPPPSEQEEEDQEGEIPMDTFIEKPQLNFDQPFGGTDQQPFLELLMGIPLETEPSPAPPEREPSLLNEVPRKRTALIAQVIEEDEEGEEEEEEQEQRELQASQSDLTFLPNCTICEGANCQCPGDPQECMRLAAQEGAEEPVPQPPREEKVFLSFEREYIAQTRRQSSRFFTQQKDILRTTVIPIACYGFYEKYDPKVKRIVAKDKRCAMAPSFWKGTLQVTQSGIGQIGPNPPLYDPRAETRPAEQGSPWLPALGGMGFVQEESSGPPRDLSPALLSPDTALMRAIHQWLPQDPHARDSFTLATDLTVTNQTGSSRRFITWIQRLINDIARLLQPPVVRLRVPAELLTSLRSSSSSMSSQFSFSSSSRGQNLSTPLGTGARSVDIEDDDLRSQPVDRQIHSGDDLHSALLNAIGQLFTVRAYSVPFALPLGSTLEYRAWALRWEHYKVQREQAGLSVPANVDTVIAKFKKYAADIEEYRGLRAQLTESIASLLAERDQRALLAREWVEETVIKFQEYQQQRLERLALASYVLDVQKELARIDGDAGPQFCSIGMYTTPFYSLSGWYPLLPMERAALSCTGEPGTLPILCIPEERDIVVDLAPLLRLKSELTIPEPHPVHVALRIPAPPNIDEEPLDDRAMALPDLPRLPSFAISMQQQQPPIAQQQLPPVAFPAAIDLASARRNLQAALEMLRERNRLEREFWESAVGTPPPGLPLDETINDRRFACAGWDKDGCKHTEPDLQERVQHLVGVPVLAREHLEFQGSHRDPSRSVNPQPGIDPRLTITCDPVEHVCTPAHPQRIFPSMQWTHSSSGANRSRATVPANIWELRQRARRLTIDDDGSAVLDPATNVPVPYQGETHQLYNIFNVPNDADLAPFSSSSAATSSSEP